MPFSKKLFFIIFASSGSIFGLILLITIFYYNYFLNSNIEKPLNLVIEKGTGKNEVVTIICKNRCDDFFSLSLIKAYLYLNPNLVIEAGTYDIAENKTYREVLNSLKNGSIQKKLTFLEGWSNEENAFYLKDKLGANFAKDYYNESKDKQGFLYPNTYFVDSNTKAKKLVDAQTKEFEKVAFELFSSYKGPLSRNEILVLASIVEREGIGENDRPTIAGILTKRFTQQMPLDADATNQYAVFLNNYPSFLQDCIIGNCNSVTFWTKTLTDADLKIDSVFNTRGRVGLPPYPICNPSKQSIMAVVKPLESEYYYYLHDKSGKTYYAKTLDEHIANINNYL